ncbi:MAG: DNA repair protein RecO [Gammaproteobacteria bacterium]
MKDPGRMLLMPAYVLHQHDWRETSRVVEILSREHGRLGAVARGARRAKSPWRAVLRPFQPLLLSWTGGGELATLIGAEPAGAAHQFSGRTLMSGYYMNELLLRLLPRHDPQPDLFDRYAETLGRLPCAAAPALRVFEKHLLAALGYGLNLERDAASGLPVQANILYRYEPEQGPVGVVAADDFGIHISGGSLMALAAENLQHPEQLRETRQLLQAVLDRLLGGRPLKTREVMRAFSKAGI